MANEILPLTAFQEEWRHWRKVKWKSTLNVQIKMASTKLDNCTRKRNYADARKFRKKNHNLTVVYVQRLCYQDTKTCFKMHSITAKYGKTWYLVQRTSFTIPLAIARLRMLRRANHRSRDEIFLTKSAIAFVLFQRFSNSPHCIREIFKNLWNKTRAINPQLPSHAITNTY